jgi:hypothetical protein
MRKYRSQEEWDLILDEYSRSEQSLEMFCQERELNTSSMYRRVRKLNQKGSEFVELPRPLLPQRYKLSANLSEEFIRSLSASPELEPHLLCPIPIEYPNVPAVAALYGCPAVKFHV